MEVLETLLELPSKLGGIGVRIEMSSSYALYAVCCILHAILKALGNARIV